MKKYMTLSFLCMFFFIESIFSSQKLKSEDCFSVITSNEQIDSIPVSDSDKIALKRRLLFLQKKEVDIEEFLLTSIDEKEKEIKKVADFFLEKPLLEKTFNQYFKKKTTKHRLENYIKAKMSFIYTVNIYNKEMIYLRNLFSIPVSICISNKNYLIRYIDSLVRENIDTDLNKKILILLKINKVKEEISLINNETFVFFKFDQFRDEFIAIKNVYASIHPHKIDLKKDTDIYTLSILDLCATLMSKINASIHLLKDHWKTEDSQLLFQENDANFFYLGTHVFYYEYLSKGYADFLEVFYENLYEYAKKNNIIPTIKLENGDFEFPSKWDAPLINLKEKEAIAKKAEKELLEQEELEREKIQKKLISKKNKNKKNVESASSSSSEDLDDRPSSSVVVSSLKDESPLSDFSIKTPLIDKDFIAKHRSEIIYDDRVQDWFSNHKKALSLQGYKGLRQDLFKQKLLKMHGEEKIIFNHRFPKIIDHYLLYNPKVVPFNENERFTVKVPGYYNDKKGNRNFGFFEISYELRESSLEKSKKNPTVQRLVFHRFFRPVKNFSDLFKENGQLSFSQESLDELEILAVVAEDEKWTIEREDEGWQAFENNGVVVVSHPEKLFNYVLLI